MSVTMKIVLGDILLHLPMFMRIIDRLAREKGLGILITVGEQKIWIGIIDVSSTLVVTADEGKNVEGYTKIIS